MIALPRRALFAGRTAIAIAACTKSTADRCAYCGMRIDPASAWRADLVAGTTTVHFDTPRCALLAWRKGKTAAQSIRVQEFYDRTWRDGAELRFVIGSDVTGPMGADLVPVDAARVAKFKVDHASSAGAPIDALALDAITSAVLDAIQ
jgi:nitrous oxide reductase accessory protein NosL